MRVFEAAGGGLENFQLINNCLGIAKFTYGTGGATVSNNNFSFGSTAQTSASGLMNFTWASKFGTVPPNVFLQAARANISSAGFANVIGVSSNSLAAMFGFLTHAEFTATQAVGISRCEGATVISCTVVVFPYSATGTVFTTV